MTDTTADGQDLAKRLRERRVKAKEYGANGWYDTFEEDGLCIEAAAFIERSCNTGQGAGEARRATSEEVQRWIALAYREPEDRSQIDAPRFSRWNMEVAYLAGEMNAALAARIPEASVEQAERSSAEPVAWQDATGKELHKIILDYQKRDMILAGGRQGERAANYSIPLIVAPPAGRQEAVAVKALKAISEAYADSALTWALKCQTIAREALSSITHSAEEDAK